MAIVEETKAKKHKSAEPVEPASPERTAAATTSPDDVALGYRAPPPPPTAATQLAPPVQSQPPIAQTAAAKDEVQTEEARNAEREARLEQRREEALAKAASRILRRNFV